MRSETIEQYLLQGNVQGARGIKQMFKVPDTRMWHIEVKTLARNGVRSASSAHCQAVAALVVLINSRERRTGVGRVGEAGCQQEGPAYRLPGLWFTCSLSAQISGDSLLCACVVQPFVEACVEAKNYNEAAKYIIRLPDVHEQMEWFGNIGLWKEAADVAAREKDVDALQVIRARCKGQPATQGYIDKLLSMLSKN